MPHTCQIGPLCGADPGTCEHDSCMEMVYNSCEACDQEVQAGHVRCPKHGDVRMIDSGWTNGYAGGRIYWVALSCGCYDMDDASDVRAAA